MPDDVSAHQSEDDARNEAIFCYVNGEILPRAEAKVSIYDSGFMLGDGIWEGLRLHRGVWAFLDEHLDRLFEASLALDLDIGMTREGLTEALAATARANDMGDDVHARLMVTRGLKSRPFQHPSFSLSGPTVAIIMEHSRPAIPRPLRLFTVAQHRGLPLTQDAKLNSHSKLNCILACIQAQKAGADEALMLDPFGFVNTTNSCNFFIVRKGEVWTSTGDYCLNGVTRGKVIALCRANGIPVHERNFSLLEAYGADEAFLTGTFGALTPVGEIDGRRIAEPGSDSLTLRLRGLYRKLVERHCEEHAAGGRP
ncbi:MAG: aminotransferase class IV [Kiloniellales bacterium]|nr:aminotransferase class IV [Kiloniellales bacterium]